LLKKFLTVLTFLFCSLNLLFTVACKDDNRNNNIPLVEVNFAIQVNDPAYLNLQTVGGWEYISGGSRGIILFRASQDEFKAYDRHCTFQPSSTCAIVSVDANNITASDNCCGSTFILTDGSVTKPPANFPLKQYNTSFDGSIIYVSN
jgi:nitrite reductase/ring-hydroxylating ferredoxin subunit